MCVAVRWVYQRHQASLSTQVARVSSLRPTGPRSTRPPTSASSSPDQPPHPRRAPRSAAVIPRATAEVASWTSSTTTFTWRCSKTRLRSFERSYLVVFFLSPQTANRSRAFCANSGNSRLVYSTGIVGTWDCRTRYSKVESDWSVMSDQILGLNTHMYCKLSQENCLTMIWEL